MLVRSSQLACVQNLVAHGIPGNSKADSIFITRLGNKVLESGLETIKPLIVSMWHYMTVSTMQSHNSCSENMSLQLSQQCGKWKSEFANSPGADSSLLGVKLMRNSFGDGGKLADSDLDSGERVGIMELFAGAIGTFKNPPSHRQVDYTDPTEASEVVLFADLLMRLLDRVEKRIIDSAS